MTGTDNTLENDLDDLVTAAALLKALAHEHLSIAIDVNGRAAVAVSPSVAAQIHFLIRELARRSIEISNLVETQ
jgi:hypothetical protein